MPDGIKRWMTADGSLRILTATSTEVVREAARLQGCGPELADIYGRLLTGAVLLELAQAPIDRMQFMFVHDGTAGQILADIWPGPTVRGRIENPQADGDPLIGPNVQLAVTRRPARGGEPYTSVVQVTERKVANALQQYVLESEQMLTLFLLEVVIADDGAIVRAGGMIIQALPGAEAEQIGEVTDCLEKVSWNALVQAGDDPIWATEAIFASINPHHVGNDPLIYQCRCSHLSAVEAVKLLSEEELKEIDAGGEESVTCEFCRVVYVVRAEDLGR